MRLGRSCQGHARGDSALLAEGRAYLPNGRIGWEACASRIVLKVEGSGTFQPGAESAPPRWTIIRRKGALTSYCTPYENPVILQVFDIHRLCGDDVMARRPQATKQSPCLPGDYFPYATLHHAPLVAGGTCASLAVTYVESVGNRATFVRQFLRGHDRTRQLDRVFRAVLLSLP
jgi:hypothetical protein